VEAELRPLTTGARDGDPLISTVPAGAANFYAERGGFPRPGPATVLDVVCHPWPTLLAQAELTRRAL
jgi:hypothetical protein